MANKDDSLFNSSSLEECGCNFENIDIHAQLGDIYIEYSNKFLLSNYWPRCEMRHWNITLIYCFPGDVAVILESQFSISSYSLDTSYEIALRSMPYNRTCKKSP